MKILESLNNSLFEKFESKRVNNLVAITGGKTVATTGATITASNPNGTDEFTYWEGGGTGTTKDVYHYGLNAYGDLCHGFAVAGGQR
jgi:hypothetical protein